MMRIDLAPLISPVISNEIATALRRVTHGVVRMVRIPIEDFMAGCMEASRRNPYMPFIPCIHGIPCDQTVSLLPEIIVVHDDDTNGAVNIKTEIGVE